MRMQNSGVIVDAFIVGEVNNAEIRAISQA